MKMAASKEGVIINILKINLNSVAKHWDPVLLKIWKK